MNAPEALARIRTGERGPGALNAFLSLAEEPDLGVQNPGGRLAGQPVAVKDNLTTLGLPTTCGSRVLSGYQSPYEATVVRRLRAEGAVVIGKTNLDEFGMGSSGEHSAFGACLNPVDRSRVAGGSSSGSAAAVGAGYVSMALGSDTGGSVRQPAAFCGVVGAKPTYGRVSRYGLVAFASSLDQVGTFGSRVADAARLLEVVSGPDPRDGTCVDRPVPSFEAAVDRGVEGLVVGLPEQYLPSSLDPALRAVFDRAVVALQDAGARVRRVSMPHTQLAIPCYYVLAPAEASSNLARFDGVRFGLRRPSADVRSMYENTRGEGFGAEVKRRILLGTYVLSAGYRTRYFGAAQRARSSIAGDFRTVFAGGIDALFTPTTPSTAFRLGDRASDPVGMYLSDVFTVTANLAGMPGISVPIGRVDGLPVGGQVMTPWWEEECMFAVSGALERLLRTRDA